MRGNLNKKKSVDMEPNKLTWELIQEVRLASIFRTEVDNCHTWALEASTGDQYHTIPQKWNYLLLQHTRSRPSDAIFDILQIRNDKFLLLNLKSNRIYRYILPGFK